MRTILIQSDVKETEEFRNILSANLTDFQIVTSIEDAALSNIEVVIIWLNVPTFLFRLPNLKLLLVCGSGVDHIINSLDLPHNIPLIRLVDSYLQNHVSDYVVNQVLQYSFPELNYQNKKEDMLSFFKTAKQEKYRIGILGLGLVGSFTAERLQKMGFEVYGWVKSSKPRAIENVYIGNNEMADFVKNCNIIVCMLPLTKETKGILNMQLFTLLPNGAFLINVGRSGHLIETDLVIAIEQGKLSGACLDVFEVEPIPLNHPFHSNPKIKITPHIAGYVSHETQAPYAAQTIANFYKNKQMIGLVDYHSLY